MEPKAKRKKFRVQIEFEMTETDAFIPPSRLPAVIKREWYLHPGEMDLLDGKEHDIIHHHYNARKFSVRVKDLK